MTDYFYHVSGKRLCAGETFGRQNMWLILAALLQNFTLAVPKGQKPPALHTVPGFHQTAPEVLFQPVPRAWSMAVTKHWCQNILVSFVSEDSSRGPQICQKFKKFWKILRMRKVVYSKFHTADPQILGTAIQN